MAWLISARRPCHCLYRFLQSAANSGGCAWQARKSWTTPCWCRTQAEGSHEGAPATRFRRRGVLRAAEIAQSSISCQTACSSCSSQSAPGSAMAQLVQVPAG